MVRRSDRATETGRHGATLAPSLSVNKKKRGFGGRRRRSGGSNDADDLEEQQAGVLNLNNPLIPRELDEDIDDDLAFNSDDEEKYGQFFRKPVKPSTATKKSKKSKKSKLATHAADEDEDEALVRAQLRALGEIDDDEDLDFHDGNGGEDGDDDEYIDLADMLGGDDDNDNKKKSKGRSYSNDEEMNTAKKKKKKKAKSVDEDGVAKKRRRLPVTEEAESIYGTAPTATATASVEGAQTFRTAMRDLLRSTGKADSSSEATTRLERVLKSKRNLIGVDVDDHTKAVTLRSEVRGAVAKDLDRYKSFLREQREAKHVQLPMPMPESNPVPSTLGAIAAAAEARFVDEAAAAKPAALGHSSNTNRGNKASALRLAGTVHNLLTSAGISRSQLQGEADDNEGIVPFRDDDDEEENGGGRFNVPSQGDAANAPTTSYMAKLKSMLSYENARRRRLNRIKSKTYRRIQRKEKEREKERRDRAFELLNPEKARARLAEKLLKARVEERVTQKHKNTSKWVRHAKRFAQFDENTKDAINEQNMAHQRLMQKMEEDAEEDEYLNAGHDDAGSQAASSEEERVVDFLFQEASGTKPSENGAGNGQIDNINNNNNNKKKSLTSVLWRSIDDDDDDNGAENGDGTTAGEAAKAKMTPTERARVDLREMKFMKQARMREETRYAAMLDQLKEDICRDMRGETVLSEDEPSDLDESGHVRAAGEGDEKNQKKGRQQSKKKSLPTCAVNASGRMAFQTAKSQQGEVLERIVLKCPTGINVERPVGEDADAVEKGNSTMHRNNAADDDASITDGDSSSGDDHSHSRRHNPDEKDPRAGTPPPVGQEDGSHRPKEKPSRSGKEKPAATDEFAGARAPGGGKSKTFSTRTTIFPTTNKRTRDDEIHDIHNKSDNKDSIPSELAKSKKPKTHHADKTTEGDSLRMHQDYLIARAFAHDDVDEEFLSAKAAQVEAVMKPTDKNASLPGWGEWGGTDERLNTRHQAKLKEIELKRNIERTMLMKSRADAALDHVIINHDGVELVPDRMLLHMIPRPFSNATEFARSMRHPTGPEWNSAIGFKDANQPRVEVRQGQAVMPLDLSLRGKKKAAKTTRRKSAKAAL